MTTSPYEVNGVADERAERYPHRKALVSTTGLPMVEGIPLGAAGGRSIFEIGFGNGAVADFFSRKGFRVAGIESSREGVAVARSAFPQLTRSAQASVYVVSPERFGTFPIG